MTPIQPDNRPTIQAPESLRRATLAWVDALWAAMVDQALTEDDQPPLAEPSATNTQSSLMSARDLLVSAGLPTDRETLARFDKRLRRFRERHFDCFMEVDSVREHGPAYFYFPHLVAHIVEAFKDSIGPESEPGDIR